MSKLATAFRSFAEATARYSGKPAAFLIAALIVVIWAATGPLFGFGDTWQLVINTGTTIITFLMVFLIQNSQNRDSAAVQIKLDELIRSTRARNSLLDVDNLDEDALERIRENYRKLAHNKEEAARQSRRAGARARRQDESEEACEEVKEIDRELAKASADHADAGDDGEDKPPK
ncbi:low affinity iron permease family protein [Frateuria sp. MAH-13]|uniref:Low affinity iron permease family protein n=1 Tax=Frateuria flava TaxID=2821489 RepID=A0ABS4DKH1_9GAMM|nr:low affinity iron permease family protein [Frateuria flava]